MAEKKTTNSNEWNAYFQTQEDAIIRDCISDLRLHKIGYVFNEIQLDKVLEICPNTRCKKTEWGFDLKANKK